LLASGYTYLLGLTDDLAFWLFRLWWRGWCRRRFWDRWWWRRWWRGGAEEVLNLVEYTTLGKGGAPLGGNMIILEFFWAVRGSGCPFYFHGGEDFRGWDGLRIATNGARCKRRV
jgi:hypothetical protein